MIDIDKVAEEARDVPGVKRVFGEPFQKNGITLIPAARIVGGAGGGSGSGPLAEGEQGVEQASDGGAGFGMAGSPAGAYVIDGQHVRWVPAIDVNRIVFGAQVVAVVLILAIRSIAKARATSRTCP